jgi:hypothetical protein
MIFIWLLVWAIEHTPTVTPWNVWFITLIIALVLTFGQGSYYANRKGWL